MKKQAGGPLRPRRRSGGGKGGVADRAKKQEPAPRQSEVKLNRRKASALSALLLDTPVERYGDRIQQLRRMLSNEEKAQRVGRGGGHRHDHPLMSPQASELRCHVMAVALAEAREIEQASMLVDTLPYRELCSTANLDSVIAFPPQMHAIAAKRGCKLGYRLYHNEFLNLIHADRPDVAEAKAINRLVVTCITTSSSATGLERRMQKSLKTRSELQMDRVPCDHFGHCAMAQIGYAIDCFLDGLPEVDPVIARRPEDVSYLRFMARSLFDEEGRDKVCALFDTKHTSVDGNVASMRRFLSERTSRLGLRRISAALNAPDRMRSLYSGLIGSMAANALVAAYVLRCETAAPSKVHAYATLLQDDYDRARLCVSMAALPICLNTLNRGSLVDKRLLVLNAFERIKTAGFADKTPKRLPMLSLDPRTMRTVNSVISSIDAKHNEADGMSDRPICKGSEFSFNQFNDMPTYAVSEVVATLVASLNK